MRRRYWRSVRVLQNSEMRVPRLCCCRLRVDRNHGRQANNGLQRTAPRLRTDMKHWLRYYLRTCPRRAAAEAQRYMAFVYTGAVTEVRWVGVGGLSLHVGGRSVNWSYDRPCRAWSAQGRRLRPCDARDMCRVSPALLRNHIAVLAVLIRFAALGFSVTTFWFDRMAGARRLLVNSFARSRVLVIRTSSK